MAIMLSSELLVGLIWKTPSGIKRSCFFQSEGLGFLHKYTFDGGPKGLKCAQSKMVRIHTFGFHFFKVWHEFRANPNEIFGGG